MLVRAFDHDRIHPAAAVLPRVVDVARMVEDDPAPVVFDAQRVVILERTGDLKTVALP